MTSYPYEAEVQLLGYAWNPDDGPWARFRFDSEVEMSGGPHPFAGLPKGREKGQRFRIRFDLIADDETETSKDDAPDEPEKLKGGLLAKQAGILCGTPAFQRWIYTHARSQGMVFPVDAKPIADNAAYLVRELCGVESRAELDHCDVAAQDWKELTDAYYASQHGETTEAFERQRDEGPR